MKVFLAALIVLLIFPGGGSAGADATDRAVLFLSTSPINAGILLDGRLLEESTPVVLKDLAPGKHHIRFIKRYHEDASTVVQIAEGESRIVHLELESPYVQASFPAEQEIEILHEEAKPDSVYGIPKGRYDFQADKGTLSVDPKYPQQNLITALNISIPLLAAVSGLLTVSDLIRPADEVDSPLTPPTLTAYALTLTAVGFDIALNVKKRRFLDGFSGRILESRREAFQASEYYERAQESLRRNRLSEALLQYGRIVERCPDSILLPHALYHSARIHVIHEETRLAEQVFLLVLERYPLAELYDRTLKALADLSAAAGAYGRSLAYLDEIVLFDPLFTRAEIREYREELRRRMEDG